MEPVAALGGAQDPLAVPLTASTEGVVDVEVSGRPVVVWALDGLNSALDTEQMADGRMVGEAQPLPVEHRVEH